MFNGYINDAFITTDIFMIRDTKKCIQNIKIVKICSNVPSIYNMFVVKKSEPEQYSKRNN